MSARGDEAIEAVLVSRDLIFTTRILSTARELGFRFAVAGTVAQVASMLPTSSLRAVWIDLGAGELADPDRIREWRRLTPHVPFLAFGSHVETDRLAAAAKAGCQEVLPRSRFVTELPRLLRSYLGSDPPTA